MEEDHGEERVPPSGGHLGPGGHLRGLRPRVPARAPAPRRALRPGGDLRLAARAARRERAHLTRAPEPAGRRGLGPTRPTPLRGPDRATYTARAPGAVAQLAERLHGMQEVRGSNPLSSTRHFASTAVALPRTCQRFARGSRAVQPSSRFVFA